MAEMTTGLTTTPVSDVMLARYVAGDLSGEQLARVERAIGETPGLAERLERMRSERAEFLASAPPHQFAHKMVTRLTVERPAQPKWQIWWLLPPVTVATALLVGVVYQRALGPQSLSRPAVTTDEAYQLPEDAKPIAAAPGADAAAPDLRREADVVEKPAEAKAEARDPATAKANTLATRAPPKNKGAGGGGGGLANADADKTSAPRREDREHARKKDAPLGELAADGISQGAYGAGRGAGEGAATGKSGYAQPPPAKPVPVQPESPPVWAAPPPPAPQPAPSERRSASPPAASSTVESESRDREANAATKTPAQRAPEPRPEPSSAGPSADAASPPPAKVMKDEAPKADEKGRARASESAKAASSPADDGGDEVPATSVSINRDVGGRPRALSSGDVVPSATLLKVVAQGGRYITVIGVRRDGVPHVYGQAESPTGQPVTVQVRLRPASSRVSEALFVVVGDAPMPSGKAQVSSGKDAAQLPLRLTVAGAQRRYVVIMSASAD